MAEERGRACDGGVRGQRVFAQRPDGLSGAAGRIPAGGNAGASVALFSGGAAGRGLRRSGVSAGAGLVRLPLGEAGGGDPDGPDGLRRGAPVPADAAVGAGHLLRHGRGGAGAGTGGGRTAHGGRRLLYGRVSQGPAGGVHGGLWSAVRGVSGGGPPRHPGPAAAGEADPRPQNADPDCPVGHGQQPAGPGFRTAGAGGLSRLCGGPGTAGAPLPTGAGAAGPPGGDPGIAEPGGPGAAAPAAALPCGGHPGRAAAGPAAGSAGAAGRLCGASGGGPVPNGFGPRLCRPLGRRGKRRRT